MRQEKQLLLDEINEKINSTEAAVVMSYENLDANKTAKFRDELFKSGGSVYIVKKRILLKATEELGYPVNRDDLGGHIGMVVAGEDPIASTKTLYDYIKSNEGSVKVIGGQFQGKYCTSADFEKISKLPSQDQMRAELLATFEAPMSQTVSVMNALLTSVLYCLENKAAETQE